MQKEDALKILVLTGINVKADNFEDQADLIRDKFVYLILEAAENSFRVDDEINEHLLGTFDGGEGHDGSSCDDCIESCGFYDDVTEDEAGFTELDYALGNDGGEGLDADALDEAILECHDREEDIGHIVAGCETVEKLLRTFPAFFEYLKENN